MKKGKDGGTQGMTGGRRERGIWGRKKKREETYGHE